MGTFALAIEKARNLAFVESRRRFNAPFVAEREAAERREAIRQSNLGLFETAKTEFQTSFDAANLANETRFQEILGGFNELITTRTEAGPNLLQFDETQFEGLGNQARRDVRQEATNVNAANVQALVDAGLAGSTAVGSAKARTSRDLTSELSRIGESVRREKIGIGLDVGRFNVGQQTDFQRALEGLGTQKLAFQERKEEEFPNQNLLLELARGIGNA